MFSYNFSGFAENREESFAAANIHRKIHEPSLANLALPLQKGFYPLQYNNLMGAARCAFWPLKRGLVHLRAR
jgi:hypothetical protein